jgi:hypothetical protein
MRQFDTGRNGKREFAGDMPVDSRAEPVSARQKVSSKKQMMNYINASAYLQAEGDNYWHKYVPEHDGSRWPWDVGRIDIESADMRVA